MIAINRVTHGRDDTIGRLMSGLYMLLKGVDSVSYGSQWFLTSLHSDDLEAT